MRKLIAFTNKKSATSTITPSLSDFWNTFTAEPHLEDFKTSVQRFATQNFNVPLELKITTGWLTSQPSETQEAAQQYVTELTQSGMLSEAKRLELNEIMDDYTNLTEQDPADLMGNRWATLISEQHIPSTFIDRFDPNATLPRPLFANRLRPETRKLVDMVLPNVYGHGTPGMESMSNIILMGRIQPSFDQKTYYAPLNTQVYRPSKYSSGAHGPYYIALNETVPRNSNNIEGPLATDTHAAYIFPTEPEAAFMKKALTFFAEQGYISHGFAEAQSQKCLAQSTILSYVKSPSTTPAAQRPLIEKLLQLNTRNAASQSDSDSFSN